MARILLIDDNVDLRAELREALERAGYEVIEAGDGEEGTNLYRKEPTDLVITDIIMPEKGGLATILDLQQEYPDIKIIAISGGGYGAPEVYLKGTKRMNSVKHVFCKPFKKDELLKAVKELVNE